MNLLNERKELHKDRLLSVIAIKINRMFTLVTHEIPIDKAFVMSGNSNPQLTLWHKRFGHLYTYSILKMSSKEVVTRIPVLQSTTGQNQCEYCLEGRMTRQSFRDAENKMTAPQEIVHSD